MSHYPHVSLSVEADHFESRYFGESSRGLVRMPDPGWREIDACGHVHSWASQNLTWRQRIVARYWDPDLDGGDCWDDEDPVEHREVESTVPIEVRRGDIDHVAADGDGARAEKFRGVLRTQRHRGCREQQGEHHG